MNWVAIGRKIKNQRKQCRLTQAELAKKIGKTESSIRKYEKGLVAIPTDVIEKIAETLGTTPFSLFGSDLNAESAASIHAAEEVGARIIELFGKRAWDDLNLYLQLDTEDRAEIRGAMKQLLRSDKYSIREESENA